MFPNLYTQRLVLRQIVQNDLEQIFRGLSNKQVIQYYGVSCDTLAAAQAQLNWYYAMYVQQTGIWWGLCTRHNAQLIGACGFNDLSRQHGKGEMGFWLLPEHWNQGLMEEAATACLNFAFYSLKIHRLQAYVEPLNKSSVRLLEKLRFTHEGTFRDYEYKNGRFIDVAIYSRLCMD